MQAQLDGGEGKLPLQDAEKETVRSKLTEVQQWMEGNRFASREEYEAKRKEIEAVIQPIFAKYGGAAGGAPGGFPGGFPGAGGFPGGAPAGGAAPAAGPAVDDLD